MARSLLPIVAVSTLGAGTAVTGVLASAGLMAFLTLGLPIGILADRWSRPVRLMTVSTLARAAVVVLLAASWWIGLLVDTAGLWILGTAALLVGVSDVGFTTGQGLLVPRMVEQEQIRPVFGRAQSAAQLGQVAGPALLTGILAVLSAPWAWLTAGTMYLASVASQRGIHLAPRAPAGPPREPFWRLVRDGARTLWEIPQLRRITLANGLTNASVMAANTLLPVIALSELRIDVVAYTGIATAGAVSGMVGALFGSSITGRIGLRATRLLAGSGLVLGTALVMLAGVVHPLLPGPAEVWLAAQSVLAGFCTAVTMVAGADLVPRLCPPQILATVLGAQRTLVVGIMPISALLTGLVGAALGAPATTWLWVGCAAAALIPWLRRSR